MKAAEREEDGRSKSAYIGEGVKKERDRREAVYKTLVSSESHESGVLFPQLDKNDWFEERESKSKAFL